MDYLCGCFRSQHTPHTDDEDRSRTMDELDTVVSSTQVGDVDYAFEQVLRWAVTARREGFQFTADQGYSRKSNHKWMFQMTATSELQLPSVLPVEQESGSTAEVVVYDFVPAALSILQDRSIMNQTNMAIDFNDPLAMYQSPDGRLGIKEEVEILLCKNDEDGKTSITAVTVLRFWASLRRIILQDAAAMFVLHPERVVPPSLSIACFHHPLFSEFVIKMRACLDKVEDPNDAIV